MSITIPGTTTRLPAALLPRRPTRAEEAWLGPYQTARFTGDVVALRVHVGAGEGAVTQGNTHLVTGAGLHGRWFALGDFIQTYEEYIASRALPKTSTAQGSWSFFTHAALFTFRPGTIMNVGRAAPLFGHRGEGEQGELLEGTPPSIRHLEGTWSSQYGHG